MDDLISRRVAIDLFPDDALEWDTKGGYIAPHLARRMIEELPSAQPDHNADVSKKVDGDCISRQAALDAIMGQPPEPHYPSWYAEQIEELPAVQPDRNVIDDCLCHIYKNISVHTATGGVIAIRYYMEKLYEEIYGEGERPWWMT